jgi:hypothetical protein
MRLHKDSVFMTEYEGKTKYQYFVFYKPIKVFITISFYKDEFLSVNLQIRNWIFFFAILGILLFFIFNRIVINRLSSGLYKAIALASSIANGNLCHEIQINVQYVEIQDLEIALKSMNLNLKKMVDEFGRGGGFYPGIEPSF